MWSTERFSAGGAEVIVVLKTRFTAMAGESWLHAAGQRDVQAVYVGANGVWDRTIVDAGLAKMADPFGHVKEQLPELPG